MSIEERQFLEDHFEEQNKMLTNLAADLSEVKRAMYGESINEVPGALSRIKMLELKVKKLFHDRSKVIWIGGTAITIITGIIEFIKFIYH